MQTVTFDQALDIFGTLPEHQQDSLLEIMQQRRAEAKRSSVQMTLEEDTSHEAWREEVRLAGIEAQEALARGELKAMSVAEIMRAAT